MGTNRALVNERPPAVPRHQHQRAAHPSCEEGSIKRMVLDTGANSSIGAYWPWMTYQGSDGELVGVRNRLRSEFSPAAGWDEKKLGVKAAKASHLALVPLSAIFSKMAVQEGYGILYQSTNARRLQ